MKTTQAWGWLTVGVLALGLNGIYHDGDAGWAHQMLGEAACRANAVLAPLSGQVNEFLSSLEKVSAPSKPQSRRRLTTLAQIQEQAQFAAMTLKPMDFSAAEVHVNCPRLRVFVPQLPVMTEPAAVNVETTGPGPI